MGEPECGRCGNMQHRVHVICLSVCVCGVTKAGRKTVWQYIQRFFQTKERDPAIPFSERDVPDFLSLPGLRSVRMVSPRDPLAPGS